MVTSSRSLSKCCEHDAPMARRNAHHNRLGLTRFAEVSFLSPDRTHQAGKPAKLTFTIAGRCRPRSPHLAGMNYLAPF
jgi:hypothetical protein